MKFFITVVIVGLLIYGVNGALDYNRKYNIDKLEAYYGGFASFNQERANNKIAELVAFAVSFMGTPYKVKGKSPEGFDCSGFTRHVFKNFGVYLPASSKGQAQVGDAVLEEDLQIGDLVFFLGSNIKSKHIGHVGIVTEVTNYNVKFVHSSTSGGILINDLKQDAYYRLRYQGGRRVRVN